MLSRPCLVRSKDSRGEQSGGLQTQSGEARVGAVLSAGPHREESYSRPSETPEQWEDRESGSKWLVLQNLTSRQDQGTAVIVQCHVARCDSF